MFPEDPPITCIPPYAHPNLINAADIFDKHHITYWYQPKLKTPVDVKIRTIVPDLYLPEFNAAVYQFNTGDYLRHRKYIAPLEKLCNSMYLHFIPLPPEYQNKLGPKFPTLNHENYEKYLFDSVTKSLQDQIQRFKSRIGRS